MLKKEVCLSFVTRCSAYDFNLVGGGIDQFADGVLVELVRGRAEFYVYVGGEDEPSRVVGDLDVACFVGCCAKKITYFDWIEFSNDCCEWVGGLLWKVDDFCRLMATFDKGLATWLLASYVGLKTGICLAPGLGDSDLDSIDDEWWNAFDKGGE